MARIKCCSTLPFYGFDYLIFEGVQCPFWSAVFTGRCQRPIPLVKVIHSISCCLKVLSHFSYFHFQIIAPSIWLLASAKRTFTLQENFLGCTLLRDLSKESLVLKRGYSYKRNTIRHVALSLKRTIQSAKGAKKDRRESTTLSLRKNVRFERDTFGQKSTVSQDLSVS